MRQQRSFAPQARHLQTCRLRLLARRPHAREHVSAVIGSIWDSGSLKNVYGPKARHLHRKQHRKAFLQFLADFTSTSPGIREGGTGNAHRKSTASPAHPLPKEGGRAGFSVGVFGVPRCPTFFLTEATEHPFCNSLQIRGTQKTRLMAGCNWWVLGLRCWWGSPLTRPSPALRSATLELHRPIGSTHVHPLRAGGACVCWVAGWLGGWVAGWLGAGCWVLGAGAECWLYPAWGARA